MDWYPSCTLEPHSAAALSLSVGCSLTRSQRTLTERLRGATFTDLGGAATERQETAAASTHPRIGSFAVRKRSTAKNHRFVAAEPCRTQELTERKGLQTLLHFWETSLHSLHVRALHGGLQARGLVNSRPIISQRRMAGVAASRPGPHRSKGPRVSASFFDNLPIMNVPNFLRRRPIFSLRYVVTPY